MNVKNVLIISPYFAPFAGIGANRMTSLAHFLTSKPEYQVTVLHNAIEAGMSVLESETTEPELIRYQVSASKCFIQATQNYRKQVQDLFSFTKFDVVILTVGPYYTLPLVQYIRKTYQCPVILDVRDFWSYEPQSSNFETTIKDRLKDFIKYQFIEKRAVKNSTAVVLMADEDLEYYRELFSQVMPDLEASIPNGYDDIVLERNELSHMSERLAEFLNDKSAFTLTVFGKFAHYLQPSQIEEFASALASGSESIGQIRLLQIGHQEDGLELALKNHGVEYYCTGYLDYADGIHLLQTVSDINVLSSDLKGVGLGTKYYDYVFCNKPILYVGNTDTLVASYVGEYANACVSNSEDQIVEFLAYIKNNAIDFLDVNLDPQIYTRSYQFAKYDALIKEILDAH